MADISLVTNWIIQVKKKNTNRRWPVNGESTNKGESYCTFVQWIEHKGKDVSTSG